MSTAVAIIASGGANIASLQIALERLGTESVVTADPAQIHAAKHVILPGVGAAADAMARLRALNLDALIPQLRQPVLGICLGMQLLYERTEEGDVSCLGIFPGTVARFVEAPGRPVPHMGWNTLECRGASPLLQGIVDGDYAYFVHSFAAPLAGFTVASCGYGQDFSACVAHGNFFGAQFHPERSAAVGSRLLQNFLSF